MFLLKLVSFDILAFDAQPCVFCKCFDLFLIYSLLHLLLCFKTLWGSDDSIFVHFVFKCKNSKWCINIGELLYLLSKHSFAQIIISFVHLARQIFLIACFF